MGLLIGIFTVIAMATTDAISPAYAGQGGASNSGERSGRSLATIIIVKTGNLGPQDKGDFNAEVTGNHPYYHNRTGFL
jgi:hypothetical protein